MCGIAGIVSNDSSHVSEGRIKSMTRSIVHRGPDGEGCWISDDRKVGLGHRRLSIIDLSSAGNQPMHYLGRYSIIFNGEIYNYIELREQLLKQGYKFSSRSDTEVIMAMYDRRGEACLQYFDGMYAFALYDRKQRQLFCARDRFGEKPFFYNYIPGKQFIFGSEMKAIWAAGIARSINESMLYRYLVYDQDRNPDNQSETFFRDIKRLPLSHYLLLNVDEIKFTAHRYWDIDIHERNEDIKADEAVEKLRDLFNVSVDHRLRSDVPVGSSLSGGLDSSIVVKTIQQIDEKRQQGIRRNTFSAQFPRFLKDETRFQLLMAKEAKTIHHTVSPTAEDMLADIQKVFYHQEEPFGSTSVCAQYQVYKLAKKNNVIVLLDGQGADEVLAGYPGEYYLPFFKGLKNKAEFIRQLKQYRGLHKDNIINPYWPLFWRALMPSGALNLVRKVYKKNKTQTNWLNKDFAESQQMPLSGDLYSNNLSEALYKSCFEGGLESLLRYADRNSMASSVEVRLPFLKHELVQFIFSLPDTMKINNGWTKWIVRKAFDIDLPSEITWRKEKVGFEPPDRNLSSLSKALQIEEYLSQPSINQYLAKNIVSKNPSPYTWKIIMLHQMAENL